MLLPSGALAAGDSLQLVGQPQIDRTGILLPEKWVSVTGSGAVWDTDGYRGDYSWSIPPSIPPSGASVTLTVKATDKIGGRFYPGIGISGNLYVEPSPAQVFASADKNAGRPTDTKSGTFKLTPGSYCDTCPISLTVGIQDGPRITFSYKVVPKPKGKPCKGWRVASIARAAGPLLCHTDEPDPGKAAKVTSSVLGAGDRSLGVNVTSSVGSLSGTTIVGEAEARRARAEKIGAAVAACYLIGVSVFDYPEEALGDALRELYREGKLSLVSSPAARLKNCIALASKLVEPLDASATAAGRAAAGCHTKRIALAPKLRKGKVVGWKLAKRQRPSGTSVRYSCSGAGDKLKIGVKRSKGLSAVVGKRLDLAVVRAASAAKRAATIQFAFR